MKYNAADGAFYAAVTFIIPQFIIRQEPVSILLILPLNLNDVRPKIVILGLMFSAISFQKDIDKTARRFIFYRVPEMSKLYSEIPETNLNRSYFMGRGDFASHTESWNGSCLRQYINKLTKGRRKNGQTQIQNRGKSAASAYCSFTLFTQGDIPEGVDLQRLGRP